MNECLTEIGASAYFLVVLPDKSTHYARPGHVRTVCGRDRVTSADTILPGLASACAECQRLVESE